MTTKRFVQQNIAPSALMGLCVGSTVWILLVCRAATIVQNTAGVAHYQVCFGPLLLNTITRQPSGTGYTATITFASGLLWYSVICIIAGVCIGGLGLWLVRRRQFFV